SLGFARRPDRTRIGDRNLRIVASNSDKKYRCRRRFKILRDGCECEEPGEKEGDDAAHRPPCSGSARSAPATRRRCNYERSYERWQGKCEIKRIWFAPITQSPDGIREIVEPRDGESDSRCPTYPS